MRCLDADDRLEQLAAGGPPTGEESAHLQQCHACASRLALARRIDQALAARPVVTAPPGFVQAVLGRAGRERWRAEQVLDVGFNIALAGGLLIIVAGVLGLVYISGLSAVVTDATAVVAAAAADASARIAPALPTYMTAAALVTSALALWWWAERGFSN